MNTQVSLQFERVWTGVGAVGTLVRPLSTVTPHVSLQLAELHRHVVTIRALMRLLVGVSVPHVSHQLTTGGEARVTILAPVGLGARVCVHMILQTGQGFKPSFTN